MSSFGKRDQYSDAPKFVVDSATGETGQQQFGNTVFGVDADEVTASNGRVAHTGWVRRVEGTGGRNGRIQEEVLVAGGIEGPDGVVSDATDFANTSTSDVANTTGTADDAVYPDA